MSVASDATSSMASGMTSNTASGMTSNTASGTTSVVAATLDQARQNRRALGPNDFTYELNVHEAYRVQHEGIALRVQRGEVPSGLKMGFTNKAKMRQMGVDSVIAGQLTQATLVADGGVIDLSDFIHPRIELEVAFRMGSDVDFTDPLCDPAAHIDAVAVAMEVIDSRFAGFGFDLGKVVADNTSAGAYILGPWLAWDHRDLSNLSAELDVNGQPAQLSSTAAILGDPLRALTELRTLAREHGLVLRAGETVLAGAATEAVPLVPGVVDGRIAGLGSVMVHAESSTKAASTDATSTQGARS